jgi:hypothetical protein
MAATRFDWAFGVRLPVAPPERLWGFTLNVSADHQPDLEQRCRNLESNRQDSEEYF